MSASPIDSLLHLSRLAGAPEELRKARVLGGTIAVLLASACPLVASMLAPGQSRELFAPALALIGAYFAALTMLRMTSARLTFPTLTVAIPMLTFLGFIAAHRGDSLFVASPWNVVVVLFITYLTGGRVGLGIAVGLIFELLVVSVCELRGLSLPPLEKGTTLPGIPLNIAHNCFALGIIGALGWLFASSSLSAQKALGTAHRKVAASEANLVTLIENTSDLISSVDCEGRLVAYNSSFRDFFHQQHGREPGLGQSFVVSPDTEAGRRWLRLIARTLAGENIAVEEVVEVGDRKVYLEVSMRPIPDGSGGFRGLTQFARDISARKASEAELKVANRRLVDISRQAGMAEIATGILHNVGNALNSVNVSVDLIGSRLGASKADGVGRVATLLSDHRSDLGQFLTEDARGRQVPVFLEALGRELAAERCGLKSEVEQLRERVNHISCIVALQQEHAKVGGLEELVGIQRVVEDSVLLHSEAFGRNGIELELAFDQVGSACVDRHKLMQILGNLIANARRAAVDNPLLPKKVSIRTCGSGKELRIQVADSGVGISPEHLGQMFRQGFTTKKDGHGFGLHMSALNATSMGGALTCESPGEGKGATFTLQLPMRPAQTSSPSRGASASAS